MTARWRAALAGVVIAGTAACGPAATPPAKAPATATMPAAAEVIPPTPTEFVTDDAHFLTAGTVAALNRELKNLQRDTTDQVVVAIYPHMQSGDTLAAYAIRLFNKWGIGQRGKDNGVVLLIFSADRKLRISVGSGLEKTLTDQRCQDIIDSKMVPSLKAGNPDQAVTDGVQAITAILHPAATTTAPASSLIPNNIR